MDPRCGVEWCHIAPITGRNTFTNVCTPTIFAYIRLQRPTVRNMECLSESGGGGGEGEEEGRGGGGGGGGDAYGYAVLQDVSEKIS